MLTIRGSIDAVALEEALLDRVQKRSTGGLDDPLLVFVPTRRLADHLRKRIVDRVEATLGVWLFTHRAFARHVMEFALEVPPQIVGSPALGGLVDGLLETYGGTDGDYLRRYAGARNALLVAMRELRDAGVSPEDLECPSVSSTVSSTVAKLYPRYTAALETLGHDDLVDERGLIERAIPHIRTFLARKGIQHALHYGAYELIGCHFELVEAAAACTELEFLLPGEPGAPASGYASRFTRFAKRRVATTRVVEEGQVTQANTARARFLERVARIGESEAIWDDAIDEPKLEVRHCQGPAAELRVAALRSLALHHNDGVPLDEIAIVARSLEPYTPFLESTFRELGIPYVTSATRSVRRLPGVTSFLQLLRVLATDFERQATIDLFRAGYGLSGRHDEASFPVSLWDRWSRQARIVSGLAEWKSLSDFVARQYDRRPEGANDRAALLAEEDRDSVATLLAALGNLDEDRRHWRAAGGGASHAAVLAELFRRRIARCTGDDFDPSSAIVENVLETLAMVAECRVAAGGTTSHYSIEEMEALVQRLVDAETLRVERTRNAGVRVLDLMQSRGLVHQVVIWVGFHHDSFPRRGRQSPYLTDRARACIESAHGKALPPKAVMNDEEKLLLATTLASARDRVVISFQHASEDGRGQARSSAFRDVARVFLGRPDTAAILDGASSNPFRPQRISAHPEEYALEIVGSSHFGLCAIDDALVAQSVRRDSSFASVRQLLLETERTIDLVDSSLDAVQCLEEFAPAGPEGYRFDGRTGFAAPAWSYGSPTAVEKLSRCPLSFFLSQVLGVRELKKEAEPYGIEAIALGNAVHETLEKLYEELAHKYGLPLSRESFKEVEAGVLASLQKLWRPKFMAAAGSSYERFKGLYAMLEAQWLEELSRFVARDLAEICEMQVNSIEFEKDVRQELELPDRSRVTFGGRLDRILHGETDVSIDDYKIGGKLSEWVKEPAVLRGERMQLPIYAEMMAAAWGTAGPSLKARLLRVGRGNNEKDEIASLPPLDTIREGFRETLATIINLAKIGYFPANPGEQSKNCKYCNYRRTCRKSLEPTRHRFAEDDQLRDYRDLAKKTSAIPTLTDVRKHEADAVAKGQRSDKELVEDR